MTDANGQAQAEARTTTVASAVLRVTDLDRSVDFYRDVFGCHVTHREPETALLLARDGFQIYLHSVGPTRRTGNPLGFQYLMWATDSNAELERLTTCLRNRDPATYTYIENGVTFVEGCDPDHCRVIIAYPSPSRLPRAAIAARLRGVVRAAPAGTESANALPAHRH